MIAYILLFYIIFGKAQRVRFFTALIIQLCTQNVFVMDLLSCLSGSFASEWKISKS
jgi:hypothetical protein